MNSFENTLDFDTLPNWATIEEFATWYIAEKMPLLPPYGVSTLVCETTTTAVVFRHKQFQVELYTVHPGGESTHHAHPNLDTITIMLGGGVSARDKKGLTGVYGRVTSKLKAGEFHAFVDGDRLNLDKGMLLLTLQKWKDGVPLSSTLIDWQGNSLGPIHEKILMKALPDLVITAGVVPAYQYAITN
jgi:hypothetical protein